MCKTVLLWKGRTNDILFSNESVAQSHYVLPSIKYHHFPKFC